MGNLTQVAQQQKRRLIYQCHSTTVWVGGTAQGSMVTFRNTGCMVCLTGLWELQILMQYMIHPLMSGPAVLPVVQLFDLMRRQRRGIFRGDRISKVLKLLCNQRRADNSASHSFFFRNRFQCCANCVN